MNLFKVLALSLVIAGFGCNIDASEKENYYENDSTFYESPVAQEIIALLDNDRLDEALQLALSVEQSSRYQSIALYLVSARYLPKGQWQTAMSINLLMSDAGIQDMAFSGVAVSLSGRGDNQAIRDVLAMINDPDLREQQFERYELNQK